MDLQCCDAGEEMDSSHNVVSSTMRDLFLFQKNALERVRSKAEKQKSNYVAKSDYEELSNLFEAEKLDHSKTKILLNEERNKSEFFTNEIEILKKQMQKENAEHCEVMKPLQSKVYRETKRCDYLIEQYAEAERRMEQQHDTIDMKEAEIIELKKRLKIQKENHRHKLEEIDIAKRQEEYLQRTLSDSPKKKVSR